MIYDILYIGSGPVHLFDALYEHSQGKRVAILEERDRIGGGWGSLDFDDLLPQETGCHIWDNHAPSLNFLSAYLNMEIVPMRPRPRIHYRQRDMPYDWKNFPLKLKQAASHGRKLRFGKAVAALNSNQPFAFNLFPAEYHYPKDASMDMISRLSKKMDEAGIGIMLNTEATGIEVANEVAVTTNKGVLAARRVRVSTFGNLTQIKLPNQAAQPKRQLRKFSHIHIILDHDVPGSLSYVRVWKHPSIHRLSDNTAQLGLPGKRLVIAGIHAHRFDNHTDAELSDEVLDYMKQTQLSRPTAAIDRIFTNHFEMNYLSPKQGRSIEVLSGGAIRFTRSTNFIFSIRDNLDRWGSLLSN